MTTSTDYSHSAHHDFFYGPFQGGADAAVAANGLNTLTTGVTVTNLVSNVVATALANGFAAAVGPAADGTAPSADVFVNVGVSGMGATFYGWDFAFGGGSPGHSVYEGAAQYAALHNFG